LLYDGEMCLGGAVIDAPLMGTDTTQRVEAAAAT
jgi:hypothetical protein